MRHPNPYIRPLQPNDLMKVATLLGSSLRYDRVRPTDVRVQTFEDPDYDPELSLVALDGGVIVGYAQGIVRIDGDSSYGVVKWFGTLPAERRRGVMTTLFDRTEDHLRRVHARVIRIGFAPPCYFLSGVDSRVPEAVAFLKNRDYVCTRVTHTLRCRNAFPEVENTTSSNDGERIVFARAKRSDLQSVLTLVRHEFPESVREIAACFRKNPIGLFLAHHDGMVVGFASSGGYASERGWLGPMGVTLAWRDHGIGSRLLRICSREIQSKGHESVVIPFDGADEFFVNACGAEVDRRFFRFEKVV